MIAREILPFVFAVVLRKERVKNWISRNANVALLRRFDMHHRTMDFVPFCACAHCADAFEGNFRESRAQLRRNPS